MTKKQIIEDQNFVHGMKFMGYEYIEMVKIIKYFKSNDMDSFVLEIRRLEDKIRELEKDNSND